MKTAATEYQYSTRQVAKYLGVSVPTVLKYVEQGRLHPLDVSASDRPTFRFSEADVEAFVVANTRKSPPLQRATASYRPGRSPGAPRPVAEILAAYGEADSNDAEAVDAERAESALREAAAAVGELARRLNVGDDELLEMVRAPARDDAEESENE